MWMNITCFSKVKRYITCDMPVKRWCRTTSMTPGNGRPLGKVKGRPGIYLGRLVTVKLARASLSGCANYCSRMYLQKGKQVPYVCFMCLARKDSVLVSRGSENRAATLQFLFPWSALHRSRQHYLKAIVPGRDVPLFAVPESSSPLTNGVLHSARMWNGNNAAAI